MSECLYIRRDETVLLTQHAEPGQRPYLHPLAPPDGVGSVTEDAPAHHPWQHGLYFGLNEVNGTGFWTEGLFPPHRPHDGRIDTTSLQVDDATRWHLTSTWRDAADRELITEHQSWSLTDAGEDYALDVVWRLRASVDLHFGQYPYGGLFLRMPFQDAAAPLLITSEGVESQKEAEGQRARWVSVSMLLPERMHLPEDQRRACVTLMDCPANPEHPVPWRVDDQYGFGPSRCAAGAWQLTAGEEAVFHHRVLVSVGAADRNRIETVYSDFTRKNDE